MWKRFAEKSGSSAEAEEYFYTQECPDCKGARLNEVSRSITVENRTIPNLVSHSLEEMLKWANHLEEVLEKESYLLVETFVQDLKTKLTRIKKIGLEYLTLDRQVITLSGG